MNEQRNTFTELKPGEWEYLEGRPIQRAKPSCPLSRRSWAVKRVVHEEVQRFFDN